MASRDAASGDWQGCAWCGVAPRHRHRDFCPCSAENRRAVKRAYAISDAMGRKVADSIRANAQREGNRGDLFLPDSERLHRV